MNIRRARPADREEWLRMRSALWPDCGVDEHAREIDGFFDVAADSAVFVAERPDGGLAGFLDEAAEAWARGCGYAEMASDCEIHNEVSLRAHVAIGYRETAREIHFCKPLGDGT
jgi:aminoglycoside 6'-N-acetyltransferase I